MLLGCSLISKGDLKKGQEEKRRYSMALLTKNMLQNELVMVASW